MTFGLIEPVLGLLVLSSPVVVLDPGHGGPQPGAVAKSGVAEKDIAFRVAKLTRVELARVGVKVILTRDKDVYIRLRARTRLANRHNADVFISIHANSSPTDTRRGCETYVLSARASEDVSIAKIHLENENEEPVRFVNEDQFGGGQHGRGAVNTILADLKRGTSHRRSARLAKYLQEAMGRVSSLMPSRGLRQAPFKVLKGAKMPAALVEMGYLTHPAQSRLLASRNTQKEAAKALSKGILTYLSATGRR